MYQKIPTSKIIAIKFSLYVAGVLLFFSIVANLFFFQRWYGGEFNRLSQTDINNSIMPGGPLSPLGGKTKEKFVRTIAESMPYTDEFYQELHEHTIFRNISKIDDEYIVYSKKGDTIKIAVVTRPIEAQRSMILISLLGTLFLSLITYLLSSYFVKSSLYRLEKLYLAVSNLDIDSLDIQLPLEGPENDEVRIIGKKLQDSLYTIRKQTIALKDFVGNASHELKTPLMQIGSQVDYLLKAKTDYADGLDKIKKTTKSMNSFIEHLLSLARLESQESIGEIKEIDISVLSKNTIDMFTSLYIDKNIAISQSIMDGVTKKILPEHFEMIFSNIINNAYKYTEKGHITVTLTENHLIIEDTGIGIQKQNIEKIREKFWQEDTSKSNSSSYGLGLSLVKRIIELYKREIAVASDTTGTIFTITMK